MRKAIVDLLDRLADLAAARSGAAAAGLERNGHGHALVERSGQESRLAQPRMAHDDDAGRIEVRVRHQVIDGPLDAPGPGGDGAPVVRPRLLSGLAQVRLDALPHVGPVRIDVAAVERGHRVALVDGLLDVPHLRSPCPGPHRWPCCPSTPAIGTQAVGRAMFGSSSTV